MSKNNYWPKDFSAATELMPADLLETQARELDAATGGKLTGRVEVGSVGEKISLNFVIVAPSLGGYEYRLFRVLHGVYPPYPAVIILAMEDQREVKNKTEFDAQLRLILQDRSTRSVIAELLTLVDKATSKAGVKKKKHQA